MNISTSECSSGCESGWTMYLDQLSNSTNPHNMQSYQEKGGYVNDDQEDEDLSMVSDASSGPPNLYGDEPRCFASPQQDSKKKKKKSKQKSKTIGTRMMMKKKKNQSLCLDDTASSPFLHFSQDNALAHENHNSISTANYEEEHMPKKNLGFFKSSTKGKPGSLQGRKRQ